MSDLTAALRKHLAALDPESIESDDEGNMLATKANARKFLQPMRAALLDAGFMAYVMVLNLTVEPHLEDDDPDQCPSCGAEVAEGVPHKDAEGVTA